MQKTRVRCLGQEDPLEESVTTHSGILLREFHGQRSLAVYSPWGCKELEQLKQLSMQARTPDSWMGGGWRSPQGLGEDLMGDQEGGRDEEPLSNARKHETSSAALAGGQGRVGRRQPEREDRSPVEGPPRSQALAVS